MWTNSCKICVFTMNKPAPEDISPELSAKLARCRNIIESLGSVVVAFSAGVDSTFLLALTAKTIGDKRVLAAIGISASLAKRELKQARQLAREIGVELVEVDTGELAEQKYATNPPDRCYHCKAELYSKLKALADERGFDAVIGGANVDDRGDFRPGLRAGKDLGVVSPLMLAGFTKADIRKSSHAMGLSTWDKPAMACLASRVPYGQPLTAETLARIEHGEDVLKDLGFSQCRVRDHGNALARIEVPEVDIPRLLKVRSELVTHFKAIGYKYISVDIEGFRSGSMNEVLTPETTRDELDSL